MPAFATPSELLSLNHLLINWFTIKMGDWGHALVGSDVLWILRFITTVLAFPILAIAIAIAIAIPLALSFCLVVSGLVAMLTSFAM